MTATLTDDLATGEIEIIFRFDAAVISRLKSLGRCRWDPVGRLWRAPASRREAVIAVLESLGYEVLGDVGRRRQDPPSPTRPLLADPVELYLRSLPDWLRRPVVRALAKVLHPDVGGDLGAMTALNAAWDRLREVA